MNVKKTIKMLELDLMLERGTLITPLPQSYPQSATIAARFCPWGPPSYTSERWAEISPLSSPLWITREQAPSFQRGSEKN